jgi:hypothetical protein
MFEYKVIDTPGQYVLYNDTSLQTCVVQEILVSANRDLSTVLPTQFGFFPTAQVGWPLRGVNYSVFLLVKIQT